MDATVAGYDDAAHRDGVVALWRSVFGYTEPRHEPGRSIDLKRTVDDLLFVATGADGGVLGTAMAGWDGHRGWLYSIAVAPHARGRGLGSALVRHAEAALAARGCPKVNLQLLAGNAATAAFYERLGYAVEPRVSMGKVLAGPPAPAG